MSIRFGNPPFLECSSHGDKRFSAFYARIKAFQNTSIEELYQGIKIFPDGSTGLEWKKAKGRGCVNQFQASCYYSTFWDLYIKENPNLLKIIMQYNGFSDVFGQPDHCCQAEEIFRIHQSELLRLQNE